MRAHQRPMERRLGEALRPPAASPEGDLAREQVCQPQGNPRMPAPGPRVSRSGLAGRLRNSAVTFADFGHCLLRGVVNKQVGD